MDAEPIAGAIAVRLDRGNRFDLFAVGLPKPSSSLLESRSSHAGWKNFGQHR
jgi:hypothetical protein